VRTVKSELVRRRWFLGYRGLCRLLHEYVEHYNVERPHQGKGNRPLPLQAQARAPTQKSVTPIRARQVRCMTRCGGVIHHYERAAA